MMHSKALLFGDSKIAAAIMQTDDFGKIKALGRAVAGYDDIIWNGMRQVVVYDGLCAKFTQNEDLRRQLLETGDAILAEAAVQDTIWGIGLSMHDERRFDMSKWRGQNLLGFALMQTREKLKLQ